MGNAALQRTGAGIGIEPIEEQVGRVEADAQAAGVEPVEELA